MRLGWAIGVLLLLSGCARKEPDYQVFLDGLNEPRGLWLRADAGANHKPRQYRRTYLCRCSGTPRANGGAAAIRSL